MENILEKDHEICILYGSQTGTAKFAAEELERELWKYNYTTLVMAMDSYDIMNLPDENLIIFIVSTTGYGEAPSNMKIFWQFLLRKDLPEDSLENLNYAIFGLGDSSYEKFNYSAKMLNNRLKRLSANLIYPVGLGDDQHDFGYEGEFDPWCKDLISLLNTEYSTGKKLVKDKICFSPRYSVNISKHDSTVLQEVKSLDEFFYDNYKLYNGTMNKVKVLTGDSSIKKVLNVSISVDTSEDNEKFDVPKYFPGDILLVYPVNDDDSVNKILSLYKLNGDEEIKMINDQLNLKPIFPFKIQARDLLMRWININGIPSRYFCSIAADYTEDEVHKEKLLLFSSKTSEGKDEFYRYCIRERRSYVEFLWDFKSVNIPLNILIELIGRIPPREYSISSSHLQDPFSKKGLCSKWMESSITEENKEGLVLSPNRIYFSLNSGTLPRISKDDNAIIIATGTGIAPFRNFLLDRFCKAKSEIFNGTVTLFFGCRNKEIDFLYSNEYEMFKNCPNMKFDYYAAFSRDQNEKIYVQDLIKQNWKYVYDMIFVKKCFVFLVGNSKVLPKSLDNALKFIYKEKNNDKEICDEEWNIVLNSLKKSGKFFIETW